MSKKPDPKEKTRLHPRNKNRERYDLKILQEFCPELKDHIILNKYGDESVDFASQKAIKTLNTALLKKDYNITFWEFPDGHLTPPIPGRADYIHYLADLLQASNYGRVIDGNKITGLDIGVGATCIYPVLGVSEYNWHFVGADVEQSSLASSQRIIESNAILKDKVKLRHQKHPDDVLHGVLQKDEKIDFTMCNPPFHSSKEEALKGTRRKIKNLSGKESKTPELNFSGSENELIYRGGEHQFVHNMIRESKNFKTNVYWFTTLVSKQSNLKGVYAALEKYGAEKVDTIPMGTGNKSTRIVAWTYLTTAERKEWAKSRWSIPKMMEQNKETSSQTKKSCDEFEL